MSLRLLVATTNPRKAAEMIDILSAAGLDIDIVTLADFPGAPEVEETGETFSENARLKAVAGVAASNLVTVADDGGLEIDALGGRPGVRSHRFLGADTPFREKNAKVLEMMLDVPEVSRTCRFRCVAAVALPGGSVLECAGVCEGRIAFEARGENGFGYDPIFYLPQLGRNMAELTAREKHAISHRGIAMRCVTETLRNLAV